MVLSFQVYDEHGNAVYRPTVHYAYQPSDATIASLHEVLKDEFVLCFFSSR